METNQEVNEQSPMHSKPQREHRWLQRLVGEWEFEGGSTAEGDAPDERTEGTETVRQIGELWIAGEARGSMPGGGDATMILTLGFDPQNDRYVGTWIGSMMTHMWIYNGTLDATERVLTLESEGPDFEVPGNTAKYRDVIELIDDDHRTLTGLVLGKDGSWREFMKTRYRRTG